MAETLTVLELHHYGLLHYLEQRDEGVFHVFKSLARDNQYLDSITDKTHFTRDKPLMGDNFTVSCPRITQKDVATLRQLFPEHKLHKIDRAEVLVDKRTQIINMLGLKFSEGNLTDPSVYQDDKIRGFKIEANINPRLTLLESDDVGGAYERFLKGELNDDTLTLWRSYINYEAFTGRLRADDLNDEPISTLIRRIETELKLDYHPGYYVGQQLPSDEPNKLLFMPNEGSDKVPQGMIEISRSVANQQSAIANIDDIPMGDKLRTVSMDAPFVKIPTQEFHKIIKIEQQLTNFQQSLINKAINTTDECSDFAIEIKGQLDVLSTLITGKPSRQRSLIGLNREMTYKFPGNSLNELFDAAQVQLESKEGSIDHVFITQLNTLKVGYSEDNLQALKDLLFQYIDNKDSISGADLDDMLEFKENINKNQSFDVSVFDNFGWAKYERSAFLKQFNTVYSDFLQQKEQEAARVIEEQRELSRLSLLNSAPPTVTEENKRHVDVGEKIGGARKDAYSKITSANVVELSLEEKMYLVSKDKVWSQPNWKSLIESESMDLVTALSIKRIRDAIPVHPEILKRGWYGKMKDKGFLDAKTDKDVDAWVKAIEIVRDAVMTARDPNGLRNVLNAIEDQMAVKVTPTTEVKESFFSNDSDADYEDALGNKIRSKGGLSYFKRLVRNAELEVSSRSGYVKTRIFKITDKPNKEQEAGENNSANSDESVQKKKMPYPEHLEKIVREGHDWRNGQDIDGEALLNTFGFKGIEYGNWVANAERQLVLNHAYDAFMDLAHAIGLGTDDLHMISMNGDMSLGFGSRGKGKALAHYEPLRRVINITKIKGAGSLGHEWMHALDHYIGRLTGIKGKNGLFSDAINDYIPDDFECRKQDLSVSHQQIIKYIAKKLDEKGVTDNARGMAENLGLLVFLSKFGNKTQETIDRDVSDLMNKCANHARSWSINAARTVGKAMFNKYGSNTPEDGSGIYNSINIDNAEALIKLKESMVNRESGHRFCVNLATDAVLNRLPHFSDRREEVEREVDRYIAHNANGNPGSGRAYYLNQIEMVSETTAIAKTDFYANARTLDGLKPKSTVAYKYWSQPCELIARSFAVYIYDQLKDNHCRSDYLVRGAEPKAFSDKAVYKGNPNPEGDEREVLNQQFKALTKAVFTHAVELKQDESSLSPS